MEKLTLNSGAPALLKQAMAQEKMHHAYLFAGPEGSGKASCAVETAMALLCRAQGQAERPCGECVSCRKIKNYNHPDFRVVFPFVSEKGFAESAKELGLKKQFAERDEGESTYKDLYNRYLSESASALVRDPLRPARMADDFREKNREITISQVRELIEDTAMPPSESPVKVYLIAEAEMMNDATANALLKTLEEPPSHVRFILISGHPQDLLPTIRSRCQVLKFSPLSPDAIRSYLAANFPEQAGPAGLAARLANGSIREALDLLDEGNAPLMAEALDMIECALGRNTGQALNLAAAYADYAWPESVKRLRFFISFLRELKLGRTGGPGASEIERRLDSMAGKVSGDFYLKAYNQANVALEAIERKVQPRLVFSAFFMGLMDG